MVNYATALTWVEILLALFVGGMLYMFVSPVTDFFITWGIANGTDMSLLRDSIRYYFPIMILITALIRGFLRSGEG